MRTHVLGGPRASWADRISGAFGEPRAGNRDRHPAGASAVRPPRRSDVRERGDLDDHRLLPELLPKARESTSAQIHTSYGESVPQRGTISALARLRLLGRLFVLWLRGQLLVVEVEGMSMAPALLPGDRLLCARRAPITRGAIVVRAAGPLSMPRSRKSWRHRLSFSRCRHSKPDCRRRGTP